MRSSVVRFEIALKSIKKISARDLFMVLYVFSYATQVGCSTNVQLATGAVSSVSSSTTSTTTSTSGTTATPTPTPVAYTSCTDNALNSSSCLTSTNRYVTSVLGSNASGANASLSVTIPKGYYSGTQTATASDSNLVAANIMAGATIFGVNGGVVGMNSGIFRSPGTAQITQYSETTVYAGSTSTSLPTGYREIPNILLDDEGQATTDSGCATNCTKMVSMTWVQHYSTLVNCGTSQNTIAARIADCATQNGSLATWNPTTNGTSSEVSWKLVTRNSPQGTCTATVNSCRPVEVWQDQRTLLVWSSLVAGSIATSGGGHSTDNWCRAAGSQQSTTVASGTAWPASDPSGLCNNATYQNQTTPQSYCAESAPYGPPLTPVLASETWGTGTYDLAKGGMGATATATSPSVRWRLPTLHDYYAAEIDGVKQVMPDFVGSTMKKEWTASQNGDSASVQPYGAFHFSGYAGLIQFYTRSFLYAVRCVGR